jgi:PAS domain S-box-containing protein
MESSKKSDKSIVLYVDDDEYNLLLFDEFMSSDYQVITALSPEEGYSVLKENHVKVLISDQRMPYETGLEFIERISPEFPDLIKIIFTAHVDHDAAIKAINQGGIYRYVMKPWNFQEMRQTLQNAIREYDLKTENQNLVKQLKSKNTVLEKAYLQIRESEKKFTGIFQASSDAILLLKEGNILEVNDAFVGITGIPLKEYTREKLKVFIDQEMPGLFKYIGKGNIQEQPMFIIDFSNYNKDKKYLELIGRTFELEGEDVVLVIARDITERKMMEQKIMEAIFKTQEETQGRYAQELHDGLGPVLSTVKMYIEWLCGDKNSVNKDLIKSNAIHAVDEAINQAKEIANNLSPHVLQRFGLVNALKNYTDRIKEMHNIPVAIQSKIHDRLPADIEVMFYRILLECINNSIKYAQADNITIQLDKPNQKIVVIYTDNGKGFDVEKTLAETKGMGIFNMQNRIKLIGGEMNIRSVIGRGTRIDIILTKQI